MLLFVFLIYRHHLLRSALHELQVISPKVQAYLYTWGGGRVTAEGERIPGRAKLQI